jgi:Tubulin/FtsZ family, GTPase domain
MTVIIAVGCAGGRMVNKIISAGRIEAEYLAINTDRRVLEACLAGRKILIGEQRSQGRGGAQPHVIMEESASAVEAIRQACAGRASVIIVAGLGGGTGTGIAPVVARVAQRQGCKTAFASPPLIVIFSRMSYPAGPLLLAFYPAISHTQRGYGCQRQRWKATGIGSMRWPLSLARWTSHSSCASVGTRPQDARRS